MNILIKLKYINPKIFLNCADNINRGENKGNLKPKGDKQNDDLNRIISKFQKYLLW